MNLSGLAANLSPDIERTIRRFPFPLVLGAAATVVFLGLINEWWPGAEDSWVRALGGLATAAIAATAGRMFVESRPGRKLTGMTLTYALPIVLFLLFQVDDSRFVFVPLLLPAAIFWLSVSAFVPTGTTTRAEQQDAFWWLNHRAVASAAIALIAFLIIVLGTVAIERSLSILFGLSTERLFYNYILPVVGSFLVPVYWLATLPTPGDYEPRSLEESDFISGAIGFLGQFILVPLLLAYVLILYAYAVQTGITWTLPQGILGWMVLAFTVTGAATVLVLYPAFMRDRLIVRLFRSYWFWLTLVPLSLFAMAVWIRVDAYGLTPERVMLILGGLWAIVLTLLFLIPRTADIRWIPALGGLLLLIGAVGPFNVHNLANWNQAHRLSGALDQVAFAPGEAPDWPSDAAQATRGAVEFLVTSGDWRAQQEVDHILRAQGVDIPHDSADITAITGALQLPPVEMPAGAYETAARDASTPANVSATPFYLGPVYANTGEEPYQSGPLYPRLEGEALLLYGAGGETLQTRVSLAGILETATPYGSSDLPPVDFTIDGVGYRIVVDTLSWGISADGGRAMEHLSGQLFADQPPPANAPATPSPEDPPVPAPS